MKNNGTYMKGKDVLWKVAWIAREVGNLNQYAACDRKNKWPPTRSQEKKDQARKSKRWGTQILVEVGVYKLRMDTYLYSTMRLGWQRRVRHHQRTVLRWWG